MDHKRLGVAHVGEIACKSESVHHFAVLSLDAKTQHTTVRVGEKQLLGPLVVRVALETDV